MYLYLYLDLFATRLNRASLSVSFYPGHEWLTVWWVCSTQSILFVDAKTKKKIALAKGKSTFFKEEFRWTDEILHPQPHQNQVDLLPRPLGENT